MMGGSSRVAARRMARIADGFCRTTNPELMACYRSELEKMWIDPGPPPPPPRPMQTMVAVAEDPTAVWEQVADSCVYEINAYAKWKDEGFGDKVHSGFGDDNPYRRVTDPAVLRASEPYVVLTPQECVTWASDHGGHVLINPLSSGIEPQLAWRSLQLSESDVIPSLVRRDDPGVES